MKCPEINPGYPEGDISYGDLGPVEHPLPLPTAIPVSGSLVSVFSRTC